MRDRLPSFVYEVHPDGTVLTDDPEAAIALSQAFRRAAVEDQKKQPGDPKQGALVEDTSVAGLTTGGVTPKDPEGHAVEEEATDPRERRPEKE